MNHNFSLVYYKALKVDDNNELSAVETDQDVMV